MEASSGSGRPYNRQMRAALRTLLTLSTLLTTSGLVAAGQTPQPFPSAGGTRPAAPAQPARATSSTPPATAPSPAGQAPTPSAPAAPAAAAAPTEALLGVPIYPGAQFITSYNAGRGQRYYLFGSTAPFLDLVTYYRNALKQKGELVYDVPATHEFDVGRFNEDTMAFPPGVTVKDYQSDVSQGYPNPKVGGQPARFPTIIQIVPVSAR
jgi:hypothetical protein